MQKKKGISLIVLVITIIVMIILASTVIISLNNNEIIDNAQSAVDKTNEKQVQELASMAWGEAYVDYIAMTETEKEAVGSLKEYATDKIKASLVANNLKPSDYGMEVTDSGVTITKGWLQTKNRTVVKGDKVLNIGSDISYDETNGGTITGLTDVDWKVLGAENGELLIMSTVNVESEYMLGSTTDLKKAQTDYINAVSYLNKICEPYGKGKYALSARSITAEDVARVTGYDKTKRTFTDNSHNYTTDDYKIKYGDKITYFWDSEDEKNPYYEIFSGSTKLTGSFKGSYHSSFIYYDGERWVTSTMTDGLTGKEKICTLTQTYYNYSFTISTDTDEKTLNMYNMLFVSSENTFYWLASPCVWARPGYAYFGVHRVNTSTQYHGVYACPFVHSYGYAYGDSCGVRAVVCLSPDYTP